MKISFFGLKPLTLNNKQEQQNNRAGYRLLQEESRDSLEISFKGAKSMNKVPSFVRTVVNDLRNANSNSDICKVFQEAKEKNPDFKEISPVEYEYMGYRILNALQTFSDDLVRKLDFANKLQIDSAPKLIKNVKLKNGESVIITHLPGCEKASPIPFDQYPKELSISSKNLFMRDMNKLADQGIIHRYAARGTSTWMVNPKTGNIMLNNWEALQRASETDIREGLMDIKSNLSLR